VCQQNVRWGDKDDGALWLEKHEDLKARKVEKTREEKRGPKKCVYLRWILKLRKRKRDTWFLVHPRKRKGGESRDAGGAKKGEGEAKRGSRSGPDHWGWGVRRSSPKWKGRQ